jgi:hypothetical protein
LWEGVFAIAGQLPASGDPMKPRFTLHPLVILCIVVVLLAGELASGTASYFASMAAVCILSVCLTYNTLGGLGSISGIAFTRFALSTVVISQFGKVLVFERADQNLDVPQLTITVYAVYFLSLALGVFAFSKVRLLLPKPAEPETETQSKYLYLMALVGGLLGTFTMTALDFAGGAGQVSLDHGLARALAYLLPFSLVLAVDHRIKETKGQHSCGWMALWPTLAMIAVSFTLAGRSPFLEPFLIIFLTCFVRNYKFRRRHYAAAVGLTVFFFGFLSPYYLYARQFQVHTTLREQISAMIQQLTLAPAEWDNIQHTVGEQALATPGLVNYFATPGAVTLNRFALIGPDSTLINACSTGYHYGFTSLWLEFVTNVPRFIYPNKPTIGSNGFLGHLDGQESDWAETTNSTVTPISDSYGAFGFVGVAAFAFLVVPFVFIVFESVFDMRRPWGTVGAALFLFEFTEGAMGYRISDLKEPVYIVIISICMAWLVKMIPATGDRVVSLRLGGKDVVSSGALEGQASESTL